MSIRRVALAIFYTKDKKILLQNRENMSKFGEKWGFFGGRIEEGETPEEALKREIKEELTYDLRDFRFIGKAFAEVIPNHFVEAYIFLSPLDDKQKYFEQKEGSGMKLFTIEEAENLKMMPGIDKEILKVIKANLK
ncbi:MAG: NUDIX domain-containing protein [Nanoarchaeota archaeon]|nr:NUDIX domain-containing protein [Nanoarchaeota archaeon]